MTPMLGIIASSISGSKAVTSSYESIATTTLSSSSSTITFSSIPATYKHLQIRMFWKSSIAAESDLSINSSGFARRHLMYADGSAVSAGSNPTNNSVGGYYEVNANIFASTVIDILDYTNTNKYKTTKCLWGFDANGSGYIGMTSGLWADTSAINSIVISPSAGSYQQYSSFALYGVKG